MRLGEIIKEYRIKNKLSLRTFAQSCSMSHSYIAMLEEGKNSKTGEPIIPALSTLKKISDAMYMSLNDLLNLADDMPVKLSEDSLVINSVSDAEITLLSLFRRVPPDRQEIVLQMIRAALETLQ